MSSKQTIETAQVLIELRRFYGISEPIHRKYQEFGVLSLFDWQISCLTFMKEDPKRNLVYSAPTSSGKTLIAEYMCIRTILKDHKKTLFILPFISVTNEKMLYYQKLLGPTSGIVVEGYMGSHGSFPSLSTVNLALCTIEKANGLINRLIEEGSLDVFGTVIVDELHMLQDGSRGVTLELILTKLKYMRTKGIQIQIIGMSATLPNLKELAIWLNAELYETDFRPVPLKEYYIYENKVFDIRHNFERNLISSNEFEQICQLCLETIADNCSILIFCHTKNQCETLSKKIAVHFRQLGCNETSEFGQILRQKISAEKVIELLTQLKSSVCGFDTNLLTPVSFGVAYHHAGLTMHEREILENAFRLCTIRVLVATTTLSSGVNLPARKVIIRSLVSFNKIPIQIMTYRQMIGRAGRMGKDIMGESYIMIKSDEKNHLKTYFSINNRMKIIESALHSAGSETRLFSRVILEAIGNGIVESLVDLETFLKCTFAKFDAEIMFKSLNALCDSQFVQKLEVNDEWKLLATSFGKACISANLDPFYAFEIYKELNKAQRNLALDSDLHMIYLLVPISAINSFENCNETICRIDWLLYKTLYKSLSESHVRVAKLIGVNEIILSQFVSNERKLLRSKNGQEFAKTFKRFLVALALQDLVNEVPLNVVADKFNCGRGALQTLQNSAAMFAGMTQIFCAKLRWKNMELLIRQFEDRFMFGVEQELLELLRLPVMNAFRARVLFNNGIETIMDIIKSDVTGLAKIIADSVPFEINHSKQNQKDKTRLKFLWIECLDVDNLSKSYDENLIEHFIAESLIKIAKSFQQQEIGCVDINWEKKSSVPVFPMSQAKRLSTSDCFDTSDVKLYIESSEVEDSKIDETPVVNQSKSAVMQMITKAVSVPASEICGQKRRRDLLESNSSFKRYKTTSDCSFKTEMKNIENLKDSNTEQKTTLNNDDSDLKSFSSQPLFDESVFDDSKMLDESMFVNDLSFGLNSTFLTPPDQIKSKYDNIEVVHVCDNSEYFKKFREKFIKLDEKFNFSLSSCYLSANEIVFSISMTIESEGLVAYLLKPTKYVHANDIRNFIKLILKKPNFKVNCFDCKSFVCQWKYEINCDFYDPKVANWILKPENKEVDFVKVCETYADDMLEFVKQIRKSSDLNVVMKSCCIQTVIVQYLMQNLYKLMNEQQPYLKIFREEMDFMKTLIHLEQTGVRVDYNLLRKMREVIKTILISCNEKANRLNGHPVELGRKKLIEQIIRSKRKRQMLRNFSKEQDPIEILGQEYRSLHSILIKVINPLLRYTCQESGRVYGNYSIYTKTGRVSIQNPSLQNVPKTLSILLPETIDAAVDSEKKKTNICIRTVFIPRENFMFLSADFCQLELRILAHFSKDEDLCNVFKEVNNDVFICLAAKWFNIAKEDVTDIQRQKTKQLCYGMLYGMGVESLSAKMQMRSKNEANEFLNKFKQQFPGLQAFIEDCKLHCRANKFLTTINGRKQYLPHVDHPKAVIRSYAERQAVNNVIQGSAADIVKVATTKVDQMLRTRFPGRAFLVLHIHDELLFEVHAEQFQDISRAIKTELENAYYLDSHVLLPVKLKMDIANLSNFAASKWSDAPPATDLPNPPPKWTATCNSTAVIASVDRSLNCFVKIQA